jgi:hypothetical protein
LTDPNDAVDQKGSGILLGNPAFLLNSPPFVEENDDEVPLTPEQALGLPAGTLDRFQQTANQFYTNRPDSLSGITYVVDAFGSQATEFADGNVDGEGIVIVHNPLFDPRDWDPDDPQYATAEAAAHRADPDTYGPAKLGNINYGTFRGIIIADEVNKIDGNVKIYGSVISLSKTNESIIGSGTLSLKYSCDAIEAAAALAVRRLAWMAE